MHRGIGLVRRYRAIALAVAVGSLVVGGAVAVMAAEGGGGGQPGMRSPMTEMMRGMGMGASPDVLGRERPLLSLALRHRTELNLSASQVKTLEELVERFRKDAEGRVAQIETAEQELAGLLRSDPVDMASVEAKVQAIETLRRDLRLARIKTILEGRASLTAEQRTKLDELVAAGPGLHPGPRTRGMEEMEHFMNSDRMPQAMTAMMGMARRMGDGDVMLGMVRMMEMMGSMGGQDGMMGGQGGMMGGQGGGMMGGQPHQRPPAEQK